MGETILDRLDRQARERGDRPAVADPRNANFDSWDTLTWKEYADRVNEMARAFHALGHRPGDAVAILGPNCVAWVVADLAAMAAGGMPAGVYATCTAEQVQYIVDHSHASIFVASDMKQADKVLSARDKLPHLKAVILFPGATGGDGSFVLRWEEARAKAASVPQATIDEIKKGVKPNVPATLIYTSGTTGPPKAVALSHENLAWTAATALDLVSAQGGDRGVSYLPLSHVAEQMLTIHVPITAGATMHFVPVMEQLGDALRAVKPSSFFGVPRVWEKIQAKVEAGVQSAPPGKQKMFRRAQRVGLEVSRARFEGRPPPLMASLLYKIFDKLVYSKLRERLGLSDCRFAATGAAPMSPATRDWFMSLGINICEVYGQSEGCGPTSFNKDGEAKLGTVGKPIPGVEVKIAPDGEILVRGKNVFLGYLHDERATKETLDEEGWLHSGDVGVLEGGYLKITDRKKDLLITAGGKNVSPQNIEKELCEIPLISQAVVIGDMRKYLTALLTLRPEQVEKFCKENNINEADPEKRAQHPALKKALEKEIDRVVNPKLAKYETIKKFEILPRELSEEAGELTPTMKIKRKIVNQRYGHLIEKMYEGDENLAAVG